MSIALKDYNSSLYTKYDLEFFPLENKIKLIKKHKFYSVIQN